MSNREHSTGIPLQAVVFDVDGTLVDTEESWDVVRRGLAREDGVAWPEQATVAMMGMSTAEWSAYLADEVGLAGDAQQCARRTIEAMRQLYRDGITVLPGAREAVERMSRRVPVGLASSSPVVLVEAAIEALDMAELVDEYVSTEQVAHGKPSPDGYLYCCELLGVDPTRAVAVEDSTAGVRSALAAGMKVVCVPPAFHPPATELLARCLVLDSLDELTVERLLTLF